MREFDIAIVGAGPAGSATAIDLAQRGLSVVLIDRAIFPRDKLCGDFVNPINWPILDELDVSEEILTRPHTKVTGFRVTAASGREAFAALPAVRERVFGVGIRRFHLDEVLLRRAQRAGASVWEGAKVNGIEANASGWRVAFEHTNTPGSVHAKLLVGADGRNSVIVQRLGIPSAQQSARSASVGFEVQLKNVGMVGHNVEIHQFAGGYAGLLRLDADTLNLCLALRQAQLGKTPSFDNLRRDALDSNRFLQTLLRDAEPIGALRSVWPVYFSRRRYGGDGFLLVGDAAGVTEPVTGEGIFFALRSGQLAARTIAAAWPAGSLDAALVRQYQRACRENFAARLRLNSAIRFLVYRPQYFDAALRLMAGQRWVLDSLVKRVVCLAHPAYGA